MGTRTAQTRKGTRLAYASLLLAMVCCVGQGAELVKDINAEPAVRTAGTRILGHIGSDVLFSAGYQRFVFETPTDTSLGLWRSDGTAAGTRRIFENGVPPAFSSPRRLASVGPRAFWIAQSPRSAVPLAPVDALWASDGTTAGTAKLAELPGSFDTDASVVGVLPGDVLVFGLWSVSSGSAELWRSDGTAAGTRRLATYPSGGQIPPGARVGNNLYFAGRGAEGTELWITDGSNLPASTHLVADLEPGSASSGPTQFTVVGDNLYFVAVTGGVPRLWRRDALGNIEPLTATTAFPFIQCTAGNLVYFTLPTQPAAQLWRTDGTIAGTLLLLTDTSGEALSIGACKSQGNRVVFPVFSGGVQRLWQSDGTVAGTVATSFSHGTASMRVLHWSGTHWFVATSDQPNRFRLQLWATDGASDTRFVAIDPPVSGDYFVDFEAANLGPHVVFTTRFIGPLGPNPNSPLPPPIMQIWRADADGGNPLRLASDVYADIAADGRLAADAGEFLLTSQRLFYRSTDEMSVTDGTLAGTSVLRQLVPNGTGNSTSMGFATLSTASLFAADDGLTGEELWRTDGTTAGTTQVMDIAPGNGGSWPANLSRVDNLVYFDADDGVHGRELWVSDGTTTGTHMIADLLAGPAGWRFDGCGTKVKFNGFVYFGTWSNVGQLWRTDGTSAGTTSVHTPTGNAFPPPCPRPLGVVGSSLYFLAGDALWRTDGTAANTRRVDELVGTGFIRPFLDFPVTFRGELVVAAQSAQVVGAGRTSLWSIGAGAPRLVVDFVDPALGQNGQAQIAWVIAVDSTLYFAVAAPAGNPRGGLYKWAGGSTNPERFNDVSAGKSITANGWVSKLGSRIVFNGSSDETGEEVFASDGTAAGTNAITDLSAPGEFNVHDGMLALGPAVYFKFSDTLDGPRQIARTNGTLASFERLTDLVWGDDSFWLGTADGELIFATDDVRQTVGNELYVIRNQKPQAGADSATVVAGQSVEIALAANDSDTDGQVIASGARVVATPAHGAVTINADGTATYQANATFAGTDTFSYVATDNGGRESTQATVTVTVQAAQGGAGSGSSSGDRGGGGAPGWLLLLSLGILLRRQRNHAADSGV